MKMLQKIRLINWHRFENETISLADSVLLSGENGSGKSTILDAVQYCVTCSKAHFNKAAYEKGKRNLNSYIRLKTGREDRPFEREGQITAHIALEFFDEAKNQPFIIGVVMDSAGTENEPKSAWYLLEKKELDDGLFFQERQVKSISVFRSTNREIKAFCTTVREAQRIILSRFGRLDEKFFTLIPKALAFKPIHEIKDFVYSYVLDAKEVNIDALKENVRSFQDLERVLKDIRQRIGELEQINEKEQEVEKYIRVDKRQGYYLARAEQDIAAAAAAGIRSEIRSEKGRKAADERKQQELGRLRETKEQLVRDLMLELRSDSDYQAFQELERQEKEWKARIREDEAGTATLKEAVELALPDTEKLLEVPDVDVVIRDYNRALRQLLAAINAGLKGGKAGAGKEGTGKVGSGKAGSGKADAFAEDTFRGLLEKAGEHKGELYRKLQGRIAEDRVEERRLAGICQELQNRIRELESRRLIYPKGVRELQQSIREQLARTNRTSEVRILCELLEMRDPSWQNAVEGYLNMQRFYLLAEPEDFDIALSVYDKLRQQKKVYGVGLINTGKLEEYDEILAGSLAEKVDASGLWARRYINMVLGRVHCCDTPQQLKIYPVAITKQCMRYQNHVASAISPDVYRTPYIGAEAYRIQLEQQKAELKEAEQKLSVVRKKIQEMERVLPALSSTHDTDISYRLHFQLDLEEHRRMLDSCRAEMRGLAASDSLIEKRLHLEAAEREKHRLDAEYNALTEEIGRTGQKIIQLEEALAQREQEIETCAAEVEDAAVWLQEDRLLCDREYMKQTESGDYLKFRDNYTRSRKANWTLKENTEKDMSDLMRNYKTAHDFGAADTLAAWPEYAAEYTKLKDSQLLEYEDKVYRARKSAEDEFREQFLSRLQENIKEAQKEFRELNASLKDIRFSHERYEFLSQPRRSLEKFYRMIMDDFNILEGQSIFSSTFQETHREAIDELFEKLTAEDEHGAEVLQEYTDYRTYLDYDIRITNDDGSYMLYSKVSQEKSGGETQTPFYITIAASFMQLYKNSIGGDSIGLIMMDEAFNNMDDERITGVLSFINHANLQTIIAAPPDKIQYIGPAMEKTILVMQDGKYSYTEEFAHERS